MRNRRERWRQEDTSDWERITPRSGSLATRGQRPPSSEIGSSRRHSAYVVHCEIPGCTWESEPLGSAAIAERGLLAHARASHFPPEAQAIDVRIRSRKYQFRIDVVPV